MCDHPTSIEARFGDCWACANATTMEAIDEASELDPAIVLAIEAEVVAAWGRVLVAVERDRND